MRTWRRLQQIGALALKQAVYVLPDSPNAREDFEWLKTDIEAAGGQANVFASDLVDTWSNDALVEEFREMRERAYTELARESDQVLRLSWALSAGPGKCLHAGSSNNYGSASSPSNAWTSSAVPVATA